MLNTKLIWTNNKIGLLLTIINITHMIYTQRFLIKLPRNVQAKTKIKITIFKVRKTKILIFKTWVKY
jgi:hypothetical protein